MWYILCDWLLNLFIWMGARFPPRYLLLLNWVPRNTPTPIAYRFSVFLCPAETHTANNSVERGRSKALTVVQQSTGADMLSICYMTAISAEPELWRRLGSKEIFIRHKRNLHWKKELRSSWLIHTSRRRTNKRTEKEVTVMRIHGVQQAVYSSTGHLYGYNPAVGSCGCRN